MRWNGRGRFDPATDELTVESAPPLPGLPAEQGTWIAGEQKIKVSGLSVLAPSRDRGGSQNGTLARSAGCWRLRIRLGVVSSMRSSALVPIAISGTWAFGSIFTTRRRSPRARRDSRSTAT